MTFAEAVTTEAFARAEATEDAWSVAGDAWEAAGDIERAKFCRHAANVLEVGSGERQLTQDLLARAEPMFSIAKGYVGMTSRGYWSARAPK